MKLTPSSFHIVFTGEELYDDYVAGGQGENR